MKHRLLTSLVVPAAIILIAIAFSASLTVVSVRAAADDDDDESVKIGGAVVALPSTEGWIGEWTVAPLRGKLIVTAATKIEGRPMVGSIIEAQAIRQSGGNYAATKIEVKLAPQSSNLARFTGRIEELPSTPGRLGPWKIGERTVTVNDLTKIDQRSGEVAVGASAAITATIGTGNTLTATEISILAPQTPAQTRITGRVEKLPNPVKPGEWVVSGRTVVVTEQTTIDEENGNAMIGTVVEATGSLGTNGKFNATKIVVQAAIQLPPLPVTLRGKVEALPASTDLTGDWKVSGRTIKVSSQTKISGNQSALKPGALVEVRGTVDPAGTIAATGISIIGAESSSGDVSFIGEIKSIEPVTTSNTSPSLIGTWKVGERTVQVVSETKIDQSNETAKVGAIAEVEGALQADGSIVAKEIEIRRGSGSAVSYTRFYGTIETLPGGSTLVGTWVVSGRQVTVSSRTRIVREQGAPTVGAYVQVEGSQRTDGGVDATMIQVERDKDAPAGTIGFINFYGSVATLPTAVEGKFPGEWTIGQNGRKVNVDTLTKIDTRRGEIKVGAFVEVKGYLLADGSVKAQSIAVRPSPPAGSAIGSLSYIEFIARVTVLPETANFIGQWTFDNGRKVNVARTTLIDRQRSRIEVGALAEVVGAELPNGEIDAKVIELEAGSNSTAVAFMQFQPLASVNAGSYATSNSSSSIIAAFGSNLAGTTAIANTQPLPTTLGGVSVLVDSRPAGLFFISPSQINYLAPDGLLPGTAKVSVQRDGQPIAQGTIEITTTGPSIFTADNSGQGAPAGQLLRIRSNGQLSYEPLARLDGSSGRTVPVTIERQSGDQLFLVLYGTGLNDLEDQDGNSQNGVAELFEVTSGSGKLNVFYAGRAPGFTGLDQLNLALPESLTGIVTLTIRVRDGEGNIRRANEVSVNIK
ncbi:MAG: DUF5666 domain-containing protein [Blastocatellia bacterium]